MAISPRPLKTAIVYPDSDGAPMAESDPARDYLIYGVETLKLHFQNRENVYVSGNLFIYYQQGVPSAVVAPDVFVIFGVPNYQRMSYKAWEENDKLPDFILEITSQTTQAQDEQDKPIKYARLGVTEYFQYDPSGHYLNPRLKGRRLVEGQYEPIESTILEDGVLSIHCAILGLDLRLIGEELRFYDLNTDKLYPSYREMAVRVQTSETARQQAERDRQQAERDRQQAERDRQQAEREKQEVERVLQHSEREKRQVKQSLQNAILRFQELGLSLEQIASTLNLPFEEVQQYFRE